MRVLVTGGAGFIGSNLCETLCRTEGISRVVALDDFSTGYADNLMTNDRLEIIEGSILDEKLVARTVSDADAVIHLAARPSVPRSIADPMATHNVNVNGTIAILEQCRQSSSRPQVIFASSSSVYGANPTLPKSENLATLPVSPYAASKLAAEAYCLAYQHAFNIPILSFRFFNVYGPNQRRGHAYAAVIPNFVGAAVDNSVALVHGDGKQTRDFTFVDTVVEVIVRAVSGRMAAPQSINLALGSRHSLLEVLDVIGDIKGSPVQRKHVEARAGDVRDSQADGSLLQSYFPGVVATPLEVGISKTLSWMTNARM